jgi:hypothetical protein
MCASVNDRTISKRIYCVDFLVMKKDVEPALPEKSKESAKGAEYESRGQVPSKARNVAPGCDNA